MIKRALYLAGGGARGAYQAGVLKAIGHILQVKALPFHLVTGVSVGSINAAVLAEYADDFPGAIEKLESMWSELHCHDIYRASNYELGKSVVRNLSAMFVKQSQSGHLLDTLPLRAFIEEHIDCSKIENNITAGRLDAFEIISNCYETQRTISFYAHHLPQVNDWNHPRHGSQRVRIQTEHILASSALPLFFSPVKLDGFHYGDGSIGLVAPLRGAIRFEVNKILVLGTREQPIFSVPEPLGNGEIAFAHILGGMMNGLFLDNIERDIEMVNRMNEIATLLSLWKKRRSPWVPITTLHLRPSRGVANVAQEHYKCMPSFLRYMLNILGGKGHSGDLLSFLLFEKEFTRELLSLGYKDTIASAQQVTAFFE